MSPDEIAMLKAKCRAVIDRFVHREALREDDIRGWLNAVVPLHGEASVWHATRAGGFGGSDIGILVRNFQGARADHQASAHDIVAGKLLRKLPDEDNGHLRRGHENEPLHAKRYYAKYGAVRDEEAFTALSRAAGPRVWMRYSPDEVALLPVDAPNPALGGRKLIRVLADYKAPSVVQQDADIAFQYACQLHQGAMICAKIKLHLDALQLSQYDWANWELKDDYVPWDPELARQILQAGDHFHGHVLRGEVPPYVMTPKFAGEEEILKKLGRRAQMLAQLAAMHTAMEKEYEAQADAFRAELKGYRMAGTRLQLADLGVLGVAIVDHAEVGKLLTPEELASVRKGGSDVAYDGKAMAAKLQELGVSPAPYRTDKVDPDKAYELLLAKGLDPESFMTEQLRLSASKHLKEQAVELVRLNFPRDPVAPTALEQVEEAGAANDEGDAQDVRDGQSTERLAQRTVTA